jgi:hypothetical protein
MRFFLNLLLLPAISLFSESKDFFAIATFVNGEAYYSRKSVDSKIKPKAILYEGDIIFTKKGSVDLQVGQNTTIRIHHFSKLKLSRMDLRSTKQSILIEMQTGQLYGKVKNFPKGSQLQVVTPTFTGGVRGTEFAISEQSSPETPEAEKLEDGVYVTEGAVEVSPKNSLVKHTVSAGQQILTRSKEMMVKILDEHNQKKLETLKTIEIMKAENYKLLQEQLERNKNLLKK